MGELVAILGILVSLTIAAWQMKRAHRAEDRLESLLSNLPQQMARELPALAGAFETVDASDVNEVSSQTETGGIFATSYADVDDDGRDELLVQYPTGAHGSALQVFGWRDFEFRQLGHLEVGTPAGFDVEDFDGDGKLEVGTRETDWSLGLCYAVSPRVRIWYRWEGQGFKEVARIKDYTEEEAKRLLEEFGGQ